MNRRNFLRLGALFVPAAVVEPRRVYSFIWAPPVPSNIVPPWLYFAGARYDYGLRQGIRAAFEARAAKIVILPPGTMVQFVEPRAG